MKFNEELKDIVTKKSVQLDNLSTSWPANTQILHLIFSVIHGYLVDKKLSSNQFFIITIELYCFQN